MLSLYDTGSSRGGSIHEEDDLPIFDYPECVPHVDDAGRSDGIMYHSSSEGFDAADAGFVSDGDMEHTNFNNMTTALNSSSPGISQAPTSIPSHPVLPHTTAVGTMRHVCNYEGNFPLPLHLHSNLQPTKKEGLLLPHTADGGTSDSGESKWKPSYLMHSLVKVRQGILGRFQHSDRKMKREDNDGTMHCPSPILHPIPFTLVDFTEEPRKIGSSRDIEQCTSPEQKVNDFQHSQLSQKSVKGEVIEVSSLLDICLDSGVSTTASSTSSFSPASPHLQVISVHCDSAVLPVQLPGQHRDSATPSSPGSFSMSMPDVPSPAILRVKHDQEGDRPRVDRDSGSSRSEGAHPGMGLYHFQTSSNSIETESQANVSTQPSSKRNSYSSHYYVNINPIMEDPNDQQIEVYV